MILPVLLHKIIPVLYVQIRSRTWYIHPAEVRIDPEQSIVSNVEHLHAFVFAGIEHLHAIYREKQVRAVGAQRTAVSAAPPSCR